MKILLGGPPGAGKSTLAKALAARHGLPAISSSQLISDLAAARDPSGLRMAEAIRNGSLAPSRDIVAAMIRRLGQADCRAGFVVDGFPRKAEEAEALLSDWADIDLYVLLEAPEDLLVSRIRDRFGSAPTREWDSTPQAVRRRLTIYAQEHAGVLDAVTGADIPVLALNAELPVPDILYHIASAQLEMSHEPRAAPLPC